jgi:hypothetical protein
VAVVDDRDERLDALHVLRVLGHVQARGLQVRDEGALLAELRVLLEEGVEGREPAQHVLGEVGAVHADDQALAPAAQQLPLVLGNLVRVRRAVQALRVDGEGVVADPGLAVAVDDGAAVPVDLELHQLAAALQEGVAVGLGVEADDVVGEHRGEDLLAPGVRQDPPGVRL